MKKQFFQLALESAMRMRECYTLYVDQISLKKKTVHLDRTKNGDSRQVPLSSVVVALLGGYMQVCEAAIQEREGRLFPFWNGDLDERVLDVATSELSRAFRKTFREANVEDLHFHDLRHEATCRLYEKTSLSDVLIAKITGHRVGTSLPDKRCFIASCCFGSDAIETNTLRQFRDQVLLKSGVGRISIVAARGSLG